MTSGASCASGVSAAGGVSYVRSPSRCSHSILFVKLRVSLQPQHTFFASGVSGVNGVAGVGGVGGASVLLAAVTAYFSNKRHENMLLAAATAYF